MTTTVLILGLGTIARTHAEVLRHLDPSVRVVGVDPQGTAATSAPHVDAVFTDLRDLPPSLQDTLDLWIIATPTHLHRHHLLEVLPRADAPVLVEKPVVASAYDLEVLEGALDPDRLQRRVAVAHHFAMSPEVRWARAAVERHQLGRLHQATMVWHDPYAMKSASERRSYGNPWLDSGPNQLSLLLASADGDLAVTDVDIDRDGLLAAASGSIGDARWSAVSSWRAADSSKHTVLRYQRTDQREPAEIWLDHTAVTATVLQADRVLDRFDVDGSVPRKHLHYRPLLRAVLDGSVDPMLRYDVAARIVRLLVET